MIAVPRWAAMAAAFTAGGLTVVQSRINSQLGVTIGDGLFAAWISFSVGLAVTVAVVFALSKQRAALGRLREALRRRPDGTREVRFWMLLGGLGGATFVAAQTESVQYLGVAIFTVSVVAAQNANSLFVDRFGLGSSGAQPFTAKRIIASLIATAGVGIAVTSRLDASSFQLWALILALVAGALIAVQQAINGRVAVAADSPWTAGFVNFLVGWIALGTAVMISHVVSPHGWTLPPPPWSEPLIWTGGFIGLIFILVAAGTIHILGVLLFALLSIAGQVTGALVVDFAWPQTPEPFSWTLVIGVVVTGAAVALAAISRKPAPAADQ